jgi:O-antigen/teichoic acid export membrane protein
MRKNIGTTDRVIRLVMAAVIALLYVTDVLSGTWALILGLFALILLLSAWMRVCPLYIPFGMNTFKKKKS